MFQNLFFKGRSDSVGVSIRNRVFKYCWKVENVGWPTFNTGQPGSFYSGTSRTGCSFLIPEGCPGFCNNNGRCTLEASGWHCICQPGWRGAGCHVAMETLCTDGKDNEGGMSVRTNCLGAQTPCETLMNARALLYSRR